MSDSNDPKHEPLVYDEDLNGPIIDNAELNRRSKNKSGGTAKEPRAPRRQTNQ